LPSQGHQAQLYRYICIGRIYNRDVKHMSNVEININPALKAFSLLIGETEGIVGKEQGKMWHK